MKELIFVRHAKSSWSDPTLEDIKRPLNDRGKSDGPYMAAYCRSMGLIVDHIISSPAKRAYKTSKYFSAEFPDSKVDKETDLYFGSESDWLHIINELAERARCPAFFSHNPTITYFSNAFLGKKTDNVVTCGIVHLRSTVDLWKNLHYDNTEVIGYHFPKIIRAATPNTP